MNLTAQSNLLQPRYVPGKPSQSRTPMEWDGSLYGPLLQPILQTFFFFFSELKYFSYQVCAQCGWHFIST